MALPNKLKHGCNKMCVMTFKWSFCIVWRYQTRVSKNTTAKVCLYLCRSSFRILEVVAERSLFFLPGFSSMVLSVYCLKNKQCAHIPTFSSLLPCRVCELSSWRKLEMETFGMNQRKKTARGWSVTRAVVGLFYIQHFWVSGMQWFKGRIGSQR